MTARLSRRCSIIKDGSSGLEPNGFLANLPLVAYVRTGKTGSRAVGAREYFGLVSLAVQVTIWAESDVADHPDTMCTQMRIGCAGGSAMRRYGNHMYLKGCGCAVDQLTHSLAGRGSLLA